MQSCTLKKTQFASLRRVQSTKNTKDCPEIITAQKNGVHQDSACDAKSDSGTKTHWLHINAAAAHLLPAFKSQHRTGKELSSALVKTNFWR
mmetsp:Transcript_16695/g.33763  ORF Transcript_16695/g.33763 Transcript_16695/m.33763 type:complete len:91 (+) Transcript_16695:2292-2564(+)